MASDNGAAPKEALDYLRGKKTSPGFSHLDVFNEEHRHAFSAAKILRTDALGAMRQAVDDALLKGDTYRTFEKGLKAKLTEMGFWGHQDVYDRKTGQMVTIDVPSRLALIYDTNMRSARAAGQWARIQRTKDSHPYLLYQIGASTHHRPQHVAWHGLLLPVDDPFWAQHMPPNGYNCRCSVQQVSKRSRSRLLEEGVTSPDAKPILDDKGLPTGHLEDKRIAVRTERPKVEYDEYVNKRSGRVYQVPRGVDPSFAHPPTRRSGPGGGPPAPSKPPAALLSPRSGRKRPKPIGSKAPLKTARQVERVIEQKVWPKFVKRYRVPKGITPTITLAQSDTEWIALGGKAHVRGSCRSDRRIIIHPDITRVILDGFDPVKRRLLSPAGRDELVRALRTVAHELAHAAMPGDLVGWLAVAGPNAAYRILEEGLTESLARHTVADVAYALYGRQAPKGLRQRGIAVKGSYAKRVQAFERLTAALGKPWGSTRAFRELRRIRIARDSAEFEKQFLSLVKRASRVSQATSNVTPREAVRRVERWVATAPDYTLLPDEAARASATNKHIVLLHRELDHILR